MITLDVKLVDAENVVIQGFVDDKLVYTSKRIGARSGNYQAYLKRRWERRILKQIRNGRII